MTRANPIAAIFAIFTSGCVVGAFGSNDTTVHARVATLREAHQLGSVSRKELEEGTSTWRGARSIKGDLVGLASSPEPGRICFQFTRGGYDARKESAQHLRGRLEDDLRDGKGPRFGIHAHDSFDDFGEKAPYPAPTVEPSDVHLIAVGDIPSRETSMSKRGAFHNADGTRRHQYTDAEHTVTIEVCGETPAMTERTKVLSLSSRGATDETSGIVLWEVRP